MITLKEKDSGRWLGTLTESQLQFLQEQLEEEDQEDQDYWINRATLDLFCDNGADPALVEMLDQAMGDREEIEILWARS
jgi:hypothetical protein